MLAPSGIYERGASLHSINPIAHAYARRLRLSERSGANLTDCVHHVCQHAPGRSGSGSGSRRSLFAGALETGRIQINSPKRASVGMYA